MARRRRCRYGRRDGGAGGGGGLGRRPDRVFDFDQGVGGRYSLWSAVGLPVMIGVGPDAFAGMLAGAAEMDLHFRDAPAPENIPVLLGLLRVWNRNFLGLATHGIMPYDQRLHLLPAWAAAGDGIERKIGLGRRGAAGPCHDARCLRGTRRDRLPAQLLPGASSGKRYRAARHPAADAAERTSSCRRLANKPPQSLSPMPLRRPRRSPSAGRARRAAPAFPGRQAVDDHQLGRNNPEAVGRLLALYEHVTVVSGFVCASTASTSGGSNSARSWRNRPKRFWWAMPWPTGSTRRRPIFWRACQSPPTARPCSAASSASTGPARAARASRGSSLRWRARPAAPR